MFKVTIEMTTYLFLAFGASFVAGGLVGYLSLGGVPRETANQIAWTVCGALFAGFAMLGRPAGKNWKGSY